VDCGKAFLETDDAPHNESTEDAALVASGLMRKGERSLPASFWRVRRPFIDRDVAANASAGIAMTMIYGILDSGAVPAPH
jgi:hypothetical protein